MALDNFIDAVLQNIMDLMPFVIVKSYERGVRWKFGKSPKELAPGIHVRVWLLHSTEVVTTAADVLMLPIQSVITKDEKLVCFKAIVGYRITDIVKHCCEITDFRDSTVCLAMQHLAKRVREGSLSEVVADLSKLEKSLERTLETKLKEWGTEVITVGFVDFCEVPTQVRLFQDDGRALT